METRILASMFCFLVLFMTMFFTAFARNVWWLPIAILHRMGHEQEWPINEQHRRMRREVLRRRDWILTGYLVQLGLEVAAVQLLYDHPSPLYVFTLAMVLVFSMVLGGLSRSVVVFSRCPRQRRTGRSRLRTILLGKATPPAVGHGGA